MDIQIDRTYKRLYLAILLQALRDLSSGDEQIKLSAEDFLRDSGPAFLRLAGITKPESRLRKNKFGDGGRLSRSGAVRDSAKMQPL